MKELTELELADLWKEVKEDFWGDISLQTQKMVKKLMETTLEEEMRAYIGISRYGRSEDRKGYRNGFYPRGLLTSFGYISEIKVPRCREKGFKTSLFKQYQRRQSEVDKQIKEAFLLGVSTRSVSKVIEPLLDDRVSAQTVSNICKSLSKEVEKFHRHLFEDDYIYLVLDGIVVKIKTGLGVKKKIFLCAYGIKPDGHKEFLDFRLARSESETQWEGFLNTLFHRGLEGKNLKLIAVDGCLGLLKALETVYPFVPIQRCWVHKLRNVAARLPRKIQAECLKGAKKIYSAKNKREAMKKFREWKRCWKNKAAKAVACLEKDLEELLTFMDCPPNHWSKIRTTNGIERIFREVRKRLRPIGVFSNQASCERIAYSVIYRLNKYWEDNPIKEFTQKN